MVKKSPVSDYVMNEAHLDENGHEVVSSTPMSPPLGWTKQPTMVDHIRNLVKSEMLRQATEATGNETFDEADDFNIDDDPIDHTVPMERIFEPESAPDPLPAKPAPAPVADAPPPPAAPLSSTAAPSQPAPKGV